MTEATASNYWISSTALSITLNAMGDADYIQANAASGAMIMCYMRDIDGLGYDNGHNYRRWPLVANPTYFNSTSEKYVYAAIPRKDNADNATAFIVYPSERVDVYGKSSSGIQLGSVDYYYIFLGGIISASVVDGVLQQRTWSQRVDSGKLASDEAIANGGDNTWWIYNAVDNTVTFLKTITKAIFDYIETKVINLSGSKLTSVAGEGTPKTSNTAVVTPDYLFGNSDLRYLRKDIPDTALSFIKFMEGIGFSNDTKIDGLGNAILKNIKAQNIENLGDVFTKNLTVTGVAHFFELIIDQIKSISGSFLATPADGFVVDKVEELVDGYKLYWRATDGSGKARKNMWKVGDQAIYMSYNNASVGKATDTGNRFYWAAVVDKNNDNADGKPVLVQTDIDGVTYDCNYITLSKTNKQKDCTLDPQVGDNIAMLGYQGTDDSQRQSAIYFSAYSSIDPDLQAPLIAQYAGINDFNLSGKSTASLAFDITTGRTLLNVNGEAYIGDKEHNNFVKYSADKGLEVSAVLHVKDGSTGIGRFSDLPEEVQKAVNVGGENLLLNSGFIGYLSTEDMSEDKPLSVDTAVYSENLRKWDGTATVIDDEEAVSGKAVTAANLSQPVSLIQNEHYVCSFKAKGIKVTMSCGGVTVERTLTDIYVIYELSFVNTNSDDFTINIDGTLCDLKLERGTVRTDWSTALKDTNRLADRFRALSYLQSAIKEGSVDMLGGLILANILQLGNYVDGKMKNVTSGVSGVYNEDRDVAFWGGGSYEQAVKTVSRFINNPNYQATEEELKEIAKFVVTHGGTAILNDVILRGYIYATGGVMKNISTPNGNFIVDENGNVKMSNAKLNGYLDGVSGTFKELYTQDYKGDKTGKIAFGAGGFTFEGDIWHQGGYKDRSYRFYSGDLFCRGMFGAHRRCTMVVEKDNAYILAYGIDNVNYDKNKSVKIVLPQNQATGNLNYYKIPLYINDYSIDFKEASGMPIDTILFRNTEAYTYHLDMPISKRVLVVNGNDNTDVFVFVNGRRLKHGGGVVRLYQNMGADWLIPKVDDNHLGAGLIAICEFDNDWR